MLAACKHALSKHAGHPRPIKAIVCGIEEACSLHRRITSLVKFASCSGSNPLSLIPLSLYPPSPLDRPFDAEKEDPLFALQRKVLPNGS